MAGEWIKVQVGLGDKPKVIRMSRLLDIDRDAVVGKLIRVWAWFDTNSVDGVVDGVVDEDVDSICRHSGFSAAMAEVGWLIVDNSAMRVSLPNFGRHNGETAKNRTLKNERQAKWRANKANVDGEASTRTSTAASTPPSQKASTREEKRREESNTSPNGEVSAPRKRVAQPARPDDVDAQVWTDWLALRKAKRAPVTETVVESANREAQAAGMTLEAFLRVWCARGSQGLQADWLKPHERVSSGAGKHTGFGSKDYRNGVEADGSFTA